MSQQSINAHLVREASGPARCATEGGDPGIFGRLDEELATSRLLAFQQRLCPCDSASAAATLQVSLTRRNRNSSVTFLTAHDAKGFAEHDWQQLVRSGQSLAVYMGRKQRPSSGPVADAWRVNHTGDVYRAYLLAQSACFSNTWVISPHNSILRTIRALPYSDGYRQCCGESGDGHGA